MATTDPTSHNPTAVFANWARLFCICLIVAFPLLSTEPPANLLKSVLEKETLTSTERGNYSYRQRVRIEEMEVSGRKTGEYRELRDIIFSPGGERFEKMVGKPLESLVRLKLTAEDFQDIRDIQPFLFTREQLMLYQSKFKGEETIDGIECWVMQIDPRQILQGQRLFEGLVWISQKDFNVLRMEGRAVPQILSRKQENLFPRFRTDRRMIDGKYYFPLKTVADDVLQFRTGAIRMRMEIDFTGYKRFGAESSITFENPK